MAKEKRYLDYLEKTFLEELNYKIWSTKGSRFNASIRLLNTAKLSNICSSLLSVYLIAVGLLSVYNLYNDKFASNDLIAYMITCLSILLLVFTQVENSKSYELRAKEFHDCGLQLSRIYNELRIFKTLRKQPTPQECEEFGKEISEKYENVLAKSENHLPMDHELFKTYKANYHELSLWNVCLIRFMYFMKTSFFYYSLILLPPLIMILITI